MIDSSYSLNQLFCNIPQVDTPDRSGCRLYVNSNEGNQAKTLTTLRVQPIAGQVMIATSGFFALDLAANRGMSTDTKLNYLLVIDYSEKVRHFWKEISHILHQNFEREKAISEIKNIIGQNRNYYFDFSCMGWDTGVDWSQLAAEESVSTLEKNIASGDSWLSSDEKFEFITKLFAEERFSCQRIDWEDQRAIHLIKEKLKEVDLKIDSIYFSNIREYLEADDKKEFPLKDFHASLNELKEVASDDTLLIDTKPRLNGLATSKNKPNTHLKLRVRKKFCSSKVEKRFGYSPFKELIRSLTLFLNQEN